MDIHHPKTARYLNRTNDMRKIAVVTSTRAEYGLMSNLIDKMHRDSDINLLLYATGMHLSKKFGFTIKEVITPIEEKVDIEIEKSPSEAFSNALLKFSSIFKKNRPELLLILGDRYEIMAVAVAAMLNNIPIAHIFGGDTTEGAIDEAIRHSITKMSHLHFTVCEESRKRVIQLGEDPNRVFNFGSLGPENIKRMQLMNKLELENSLDFRFNKKNFLVTFHPVTLEGNSKEQFDELLKALESFKDTNIIITAPNSDDGNKEIFEMIEQFLKTHKNVRYYKSLGAKKYFSVIKFVDMVIGNSSSGILEVPSFKKATINIGNRQKGRMQAESIINCNAKKEDIIKAIEKAYKTDFSQVQNPYAKENTSDNIISIIKNYNLENILKKTFYNI